MNSQIETISFEAYRQIFLLKREFSGAHRRSLIKKKEETLYYPPILFFFFIVVSRWLASLLSSFVWLLLSVVVMCIRYIDDMT